MMKTTSVTTLVLGLTALALTAPAQLQWSSYDTSGNLVNANAGSGNTVNLAVPANTTLVFVTRNFEPLDLSAGGAVSTVNFTFEASGALTGTAGGLRNMGWGLYNTAGTDGLADDAGYWTRFNYGNYPELFTHASSDGANLFSGSQQGQGGSYTGSPEDAITYDALIRLQTDGGGTGIALGSGSALASAGIAIQGSGVDERAYINPVTPPPDGQFTFDEFAFMFNNWTANPVTLTLGTADLTAMIPEPSTFALAGMALFSLILARRRQ